MLARLFALRYLFSPKSRSVINIIAGVSVLSFAMPVAAMIVLLAILNGFGSFMRSISSTFDADLTVTPREGQTFAATSIDTAALASIDGVEALCFLLEEQVLIARDGRQTTVLLRGIDDRYGEVFPIGGMLRSGSWESPGQAQPRLIVGRDLAVRTLGLRNLTDPETELSVYALRRGSFSSLLPLDGYSVRRFGIGGVFVHDQEREGRYVLCPLAAARELLDRPQAVSALSLRLSEGSDARRMRRIVQAAAGDGFEVRTREQMNDLFFRMLSYEKWGIFLIMLLVLVLASCSVVGTLVMLMIEKREDAATLRAMGADTRFIRSVFVGEGVLIGAGGAIVGGVLGIACCLLQQRFGLIRIPIETALLQSYPVELRWSDLWLVAALFGTVIYTVSQATVRSVMHNDKM
ncbi:MAG: FtsX-like permease family protein [Alistipes sp.]|nr:FtsX-like permease family protein [Alistipes sp.]